MKQITVTAFCDDPFEQHGDGVSATEEQMVTRHRVNYTLDVCEPCSGELTKMLDRWMEIGTPVRIGRPPKNAPRAPGAPRAARRGEPDTTLVVNRTCPDCGFVSVNRSALGVHVRRDHNKGLSDYSDSWVLVPY